MTALLESGTGLEVPSQTGEEFWPTLGPQVCDFIEAYLVHGPGDLRGKPARIDDEKRGLIYRAYEVYPQGHPQAGRRRFKRVALSLRKGSAKTELAAWIVACELHPDGPVRSDGFDAAGDPVGVGVIDPYIPMVAYTEEQSDDLAYKALFTILGLSKIADDFDIGLERIMRIKGDGKAVALASAPSARDGALTTFQHFDETHHFTLARLKNAHKTMLANIPKRMLADAWSLETTTAPCPGEGSVAEKTMEYAEAVAEGRQSDSRLFFFHRQASDQHDLTDPAGLRAAIIEASGPVAAWSDIDSIAELWNDPTADHAFLARVWLNRLVQASERALDSRRWAALAKKGYEVTDGELITLGFDGSRYQDATAIIGTEIVTGFQFVVGAWEKPLGPKGEGWEVPQAEVNEAMAAAFERWEVWRLYADPPYWESCVGEWSGKYGEEVVIAWPTNRWAKMAAACLAYKNAMTSGDLSHDGDALFARHIGNAHKLNLHTKDEDGHPAWVMVKDRKNSPNKIDAAVTGAISWQARTDARALGIGNRAASPYSERGLIFI